VRETVEAGAVHPVARQAATSARTGTRDRDEMASLLLSGTRHVRRFDEVAQGRSDMRR
jgi:hypothetical protein